ncbi:FUSC family protein [Pseudalkalibacillus berkeleyi]|uniref:Aromatic acid exporter family protein n=1 Tax=Pseudalkalibacillus berkeleyi TaxID=1069813 RepID=A0ABS9H4Z6_9BACL|nr:aromatic acid exporter family protein [Pseudalkalibacillus berkeleyi]MCF6138996.1 aromatic acid exporter family protein [Pseudalkalibacillus berkeleyi]
MSNVSGDVMKKLNIQKWVGGRVIKTGLAAFVTALICNLLQLPVLFAVITAIVTVEPTASDSIKKGMIRFPAAMIGAAFAMGFEFFLGPSSLTYALAATLTLLTCHKLRLDAGMLVATLTAVAMIAETEDQFFTSFVVRLSTTLIGLVVSTVINYLILPPHYHEMVREKVDQLYERSGTLLSRFVKGGSHRELQTEYRTLSQEMERTFSLSQYQREEWKYRRHNLKEIREFGILMKKLEYYQKILYHFANLLYLNLDHAKLSPEKVEVIMKAVDSIGAILKDPAHRIEADHIALIEELDALFASERERRIYTDQKSAKKHLSVRVAIIYELLALEDVLEDLDKICSREKLS